MTPHGFPRLDRGLADLARERDLVLCDIWGVVHNGLEYHASAVEALGRFRQAGGTVILITNAPSPKARVQRWLDRLHVPRQAYDDIATSGDVTVDLIVEAGCPPLFAIGPREETALYDAAAAAGSGRPALVAIERARLAICIGLDETGDAPADYDPILRALRAQSLDLICANPDIVVEVGDTLVYCAGAIAERYAALGGRVVQAGKPFPAIYAKARTLAEAIRGPTSNDRVLAIGDAMNTDIRGANAEGLASLFITSGIHRGALHEGNRESRLDKTALARLLEDYAGTPAGAIVPTAALPALRWTL